MFYNKSKILQFDDTLSVCSCDDIKECYRCLTYKAFHRFKRNKNLKKEKSTIQSRTNSLKTNTNDNNDNNDFIIPNINSMGIVTINRGIRMKRPSTISLLLSSQKRRQYEKRKRILRHMNRFN
jgi:hypothetical protein